MLDNETLLLPIYNEWQESESVAERRVSDFCSAQIVTLTMAFWQFWLARRERAPLVFYESGAAKKSTLSDSGSTQFWSIECTESTRARDALHEIAERAALPEMAPCLVSDMSLLYFCIELQY